jgi:hypothetical protein
MHLSLDTQQAIAQQRRQYFEAQARAVRLTRAAVPTRRRRRLRVSPRLSPWLRLQPGRPEAAT